MNEWKSSNGEICGDNLPSDVPYYYEQPTPDISNEGKIVKITLV